MSTITDSNPYVEEMLRLMNMAHQLGLDPQARDGACVAFYEFIDDAHGLEVAEEAWFDAYEMFKSERSKEVSNV